MAIHPRTIVFWAIFVALSIPCLAQFKKEIVPMRTTCEEAAAILKVPTCKENLEIYFLANETVTVSYSSEKCQLAFGKRWNIPIGTVTSVVTSFKKPFPLASFVRDVKPCEKSVWMDDVDDTFTYSCVSLGMSVSVLGDYVHQVTYYPTPADDRLLCKQDCNGKP